MRFLLVVPPFTGHVTPLVPVARELERRGHAVAWVGTRAAVERLLPAGAALYDAPLAGPLPTAADTARGGMLASVRHFFESLVVPIAGAMVPSVEAAADAFAPDVLVVDQHALAGSLVARRRALPWATSTATPQATAPTFDLIPGLREWFDERMATLEHEAGLAPSGTAGLSPDLVLVYSTRELAGDRPYPASYRFVGRDPGAADGGDFPWEALAEGRRVLVTLGTAVSEFGDAFYRTAVEALGGRDLQVILAGPSERVGAPAPNVLVGGYVPQLALLHHVDAVVCHGGHNTVCETLAVGRPLVVAPAIYDQGVVAHQVVEAGAGVRVRFTRLRAAELADAVRRVLDEPSFRRNAERIAASFREAGGACAAAAALEALA